MNPTLSNVHHETMLQNITIAYRNQIYIADGIAPVIPVQKQSDYYYIFDRASELRDTAGYRSPGTSSNRDGFTLSEAKYSTKEIAQSTQLEDEVDANADRVLNIRLNKTRFVTNKILLKHEILTEAKLMTTGNWANSATPTVLWSDYDASDPISDIETAISTIEDATGYAPNTMVMAKNVWKILKHHPQLLARLSNDSLRVLKINELSLIFDELEYIYIGKASKNTSEQGITASYSNIWSKDVWIGYVNKNPGLESPSAIYTFGWDYTGSRGGEPIGIGGVRRWRDENIHSDIIEAYKSYDQKITGSDLGYVLEAVIA